MRLSVLALMAVVTPSTAAVASNQASALISAEVPLVCTATLSGTSLSGSGSTVGVLEEFCNNGRGYRVLASVTGDVDGAMLLVDGVPHRLAAGTEIEIVSEQSAKLTRRTLAFEAARADQSGEISVRAVAR